MHAQSLVGMEETELRDEISHVLAYVLGITGTRPCYVRPPGGVTSPNLEDMFEVRPTKQSLTNLNCAAASALVLLPDTHDLRPISYRYRLNARV